jgi:hypothetical protein
VNGDDESITGCGNKNSLQNYKQMIGVPQAHQDRLDNA